MALLRTRIWVLMLGLSPALACGAGITTRDAPDKSAPTSVPRETPLPSLSIPFDPRDRPKLIDRLAGSVFAYYRYIDGPFTERVCAKYVPKGEALAQVNLHGDAHLEQYAIADDGRGLADFDTASMGPAIVDLLRFSTSLHLAARDRFDASAADRAVGRFLDGYRAALDDPSASGPEPVAAARIRASFDGGAGPWLDRVDKLIQPMTDAQREHLARSSKSYVDAILAQNPDLDRGFFTFKHAGPLDMGIGSAHEMKFLARVEGPTPRPDDDVILETKQVVGHSMGRCVHGGEWGDALRVIVGQARLSPAPQRFLGHVELEGKTFYVHAWRVHYTELALADVRSSDELGEIAFDVGLQLGRGHPKQLAHGDDGALRRELLDEVRREDATIHEASRTLADDTIEAWRRFRRDAGR